MNMKILISETHNKMIVSYIITLIISLNIVHTNKVDSRNFFQNILKNEIMKTFPGVNENTLLADFLNNETYVKTLMSIQLQMCYFDVLVESKVHRNRRDLAGELKALFPDGFWDTNDHKGYYNYLKHLDPRRWYKEAFEWVEIKSSLPPLYYIAKYCPYEIRFLKHMNYTEEYYVNLTWPPGLDPLWTGNPNMTTNLFTEITSSSSSEDSDTSLWDGETTTYNPYDFENHDDRR